MIWGSGVKSLKWVLSGGKTLLLSWNYSHLFWCPIAYNIEYHLIGDLRSEDKKITEQEARSLLPGTELEVPFWDRYGGYILITGIVLCWIIF